LKKLIDDALKAPSNDHMRRWYFINVSESRKKINGIIKRMELTGKLQIEIYRDAISKQKKMLLEAPVLLFPNYTAEIKSVHQFDEK